MSQSQQKQKLYYTPTTGVRADFKKLMNIFLSSATVRFEQFSEVWRALNMSYICAARNQDREAREFVEKLFLIAREYFLPPYQFQVRVGGLYLLYAIYQVQPLSPKVKIRLTHSEWDDCLYFLQQANLQSHLDVVYVFNRLIYEQAFQFCFTPDEMGFRPHGRAADEDEMDLADEMKEERSLINKLFNYESMEQLSYLQDQYQKMKIALAGPEASKPDKSLDVVKEELVEDIVLSLQTFKEKVANLSKFGKVNNTTEADQIDTEKEKKQSVGSRRLALKNQAYSSSPSKKKGLHHISSDTAEESPVKSASKSPQATRDKRPMKITKINPLWNRGEIPTKSNGEKHTSESSGLEKMGKDEQSLMRMSGPGTLQQKEPSAPLMKTSAVQSSLPSASKRIELYLSSDDSDEDDEDYLPASERHKGKKRLPVAFKTASHRKFSFKDALKPFPSPVSGSDEFSPSKENKESDSTKTSKPTKKGPGFRIMWTPVLKPAASAERKDGNDSFSQDSLETEELSSPEKDGCSKVSQEENSGVRKKKSPAAGHKVKLVTISKPLFKGLSDNALRESAQRSKQHLSMLNNGKLSQKRKRKSEEPPPFYPGQKGDGVFTKTQSYEFFMAPTSKGVLEDLGNDADKPMKKGAKKSKKEEKKKTIPSTYVIEVAPTGLWKHKQRNIVINPKKASASLQPENVNTNTMSNHGFTMTAKQPEKSEDITQTKIRKMDVISQPANVKTNSASKAHFRDKSKQPDNIEETVGPGSKSFSSKNKNKKQSQKKNVQEKLVKGLKKATGKGLHNHQIILAPASSVRISNIGGEAQRLSQETDHLSKGFLVDKSTMKDAGASSNDVILTISSNNHESTGKNIQRPPIQLEIPKAKLSHTIKGKFVSVKNYDKKCKTVTAIESDLSPKRSASSTRNLNDSTHSSKGDLKSPNQVVAEKEEKSITVGSQEQSADMFLSTKTTTGKKKAGKMGEDSQPPVKSVQKVQIVHKERPSKYYTRIPSLSQETGVLSNSKPVTFKRDTLSEAFHAMTAKPLIINDQVPTLEELKKRIRKKLKKNWSDESEPVEIKVEKPLKGNVVLDNYKFI